MIHPWWTKEVPFDFRFEIFVANKVAPLFVFTFAQRLFSSDATILYILGDICANKHSIAWSFCNSFLTVPNTSDTSNLFSRWCSSRGRAHSHCVSYLTLVPLLTQQFVAQIDRHVLKYLLEQCHIHASIQMGNQIVGYKFNPTPVRKAGQPMHCPYGSRLHT